jgi:hypothetical protein
MNSEKENPGIILNISKWEILLLIVNIIVFAIIINYFVVNWNEIPEVIISTGKKISKEFSTICCAWFNIFALSLSYKIVFSKPRKFYSTGKRAIRVSQNIQKAKKQYRIITSCYLCNFAIFNGCNNISWMANIDRQVKHIKAFDIWSVPFPIIAMIITWLIHHILWTRLSDK